jgi:hypothetical protein
VPGRSSPAPIQLIGFVWFLAAIVTGASGLLLRVPAPALQAILVALTLALFIAAVGVASFGAWLAAVDLSAVIAVHLTRFIGIYFLVLYRRGLLPFDFAVLGGWGDILIAAAAFAWLVFAADPARHRGWLWAWNLAGLIDILLVVAIAGRQGAADPASMGPLRVLPLSLLPTFLVPIIIGSHALIFWRLRRRTSLREA